MEELIGLIESLDFEEFDYYYHITGRGFGNDAINEGLYLEEPDLKTTMIKLPKEMIEDPIEYCANEYSDGLVKRQEMVIIGCEKDLGNSIIEESDIPKWIGDQKLNYLVRSENILGYIDLETLNITYNPEYIDFNYRR